MTGTSLPKSGCAQSKPPPSEVPVMTANSRARKSNDIDALPMPTFDPRVASVVVVLSIGTYDRSRLTCSRRHATCVRTRRNQAMPIAGSMPKELSSVER